MNFQFMTILIMLISCSFLYAQQQDTLKFSHKKHVQDFGISCTDCHTSVTSNTGGKPNHPKMKNCAQCHEEDFSEQNCTRCHSDPSSAKPFKIELKHKNFSHADHLQQGVDCSYCHKDVDQVAIATEKHLPSMDVCMSCHNDKKAPSNCYMCHQDPQRIKPESHNSPWFLKKEHGRDARFGHSQCEKCHQETSCDACHMGQTSVKIHDPGFSFTHGREAKKNDKKCNLCHDVQNSCVQCHTNRKK